MSRTSFVSLCDTLRPFVQQQSTRMRSLVEVERQVALTVYYLADEGRRIKNVNAFGLSSSTVLNVVGQVCHAMLFANSSPEDQTKSKRKDQEIFWTLAIPSV